jgi:hypothetical protein
MRLSHFIDPTPEWNHNTWYAGHFGSGRNKTRSVFDNRIARRMHTGWDQAAPRQSDIVAPAAGTVIRAKYSSGIGHNVVLRHDDVEIDIELIGRAVRVGDVVDLYSRHGHMWPNHVWQAKQFTVAVGDKVERGQRLGYVGTSGASSGYHNHWSITVGVPEYQHWTEDVHIDPEKVVLGSSPEYYYEYHGYPLAYFDIPGVRRPLLRRRTGGHQQDAEDAQAALKARGYSLVVDGKFGPGTESVVLVLRAWSVSSRTITGCKTMESSASQPGYRF